MDWWRQRLVRGNEMVAHPPTLPAAVSFPIEGGLPSRLSSAKQAEASPSTVVGRLRGALTFQAYR
jgi:hypothetical protein